MTLFNIYEGEARDGYIETRIIRAQLKFRFAGPKTTVFKPGMPYEGHIYLMYDDDQALSAEKLAGATLTIRPTVTSTNGQLKTLPEIFIPAKGVYRPEEFNHYDNVYDVWMAQQMQEAEYKTFRETGIYNFRVKFSLLLLFIIY